MIAALAFGVSGVATAWLRARGSLKDVRQQSLSLHARGGLHIVDDLTDTEFGVSLGIRDTSVFIKRDLLAEVAQAVSDRTPLLIVGPSMSGKTRLAVEALRSGAGSQAVLIAETGPALVSLLKEGAEPRGCVIWLDDLERFLTDGLTAGMVDRLRAGRNLLIATMRATERERYDPDSKIKPPGWDVIAQFHEMHLASRLTEAETDLLPDSPYADIEDAAGAYGLAEYLGGAPLAWARFSRGETTHALGWASVRAAADWRQITGEPIGQVELESLAPEYLPQYRRHDTYDRTAELEWASFRVNETVRLLAPVPGGWQVFEYILDRLTQEGEHVPGATWHAVAQAILPSASALKAGFAALRAGELEIAKERLLPLVESTDLDIAASTALALGLVESERGEASSAEQWYLKAIGFDNPDMVAPAAINLGILRDRNGDLVGAEQAYQRAIEIEHEHWTPAAFQALGTFRANHGDLAGARVAFQTVIDSGSPAWVPQSTAQLGNVLERDGEFDAAIEAYQRALDSGQTGPHWTPGAATHLGVLREVRGDLSGAKAAYRTALETGDDAFGPLAAGHLLDLLGKSGDSAAAEEVFQRVLDFGLQEIAPTLAMRMGSMRAGQGDQRGAAAAYQVAKLAEDPAARVKAARAAGRPPRSDEDLAELADQFQRLSGKGAVDLGRLLEERGDDAAAIEAYQQAIDSVLPTLAAEAGFQLGGVYVREADLRRAESEFRRAAELGDPLWSPAAAYSLGLVLVHGGNYGAARLAFEQATGATLNEDVAARARESLKDLLELERAADRDDAQ